MSRKITKPQISALQKERETTTRELKNLRDALRIKVEVEDIDEVASELIERDKTQALIITLEEKLRDIEHAMNHAESTGYGICERCGKLIDPERLEIFPETTLCVECKLESEQLARRQQRL